MAVERCDECGYDAGDWSDSSAIAAIEGLPACWHEALAGLASQDLHRRPIPSMWSIAEYADHVREVLFGMRFLLDTAITTPGADLGESPSSQFDPEPRRIEIKVALAGIEHEATGLRERLTQLSPDQWNLAVRLDGDDVNPHWIARHVVHDATHHLGDVAHLRAALDCPFAGTESTSSMRRMSVPSTHNVMRQHRQTGLIDYSPPNLGAWRTSYQPASAQAWTLRK